MKTAVSRNVAVPAKDAADTAAVDERLWAGQADGAGQRERAPYLTPRQLEVLKLLCEGLPNKLICRRLNISTGTVKVHISGILRELGVTSRLQAVVAARRGGLLGDVPAGAGAAEPASESHATRASTERVAVAA